MKRHTDEIEMGSIYYFIFYKAKKITGKWHREFKRDTKGERGKS